MSLKFILQFYAISENMKIRSSNIWWMDSDDQAYVC